MNRFLPTGVGTCIKRLRAKITIQQMRIWR